MGTSFCSTCATATSGGPPGPFPDACFGRIAPTSKPIAPPITSLRLEELLIFISDRVPCATWLCFMLRNGASGRHQSAIENAEECQYHHISEHCHRNHRAFTP